MGWLGLLGRETAMVSPMSLGLRGGLSFRRGFLAGGSIVVDGSRAGPASLAFGAADFEFLLACDARAPLKGAMPRSVANLYFLIFAVEIRDVK
jgi:hypothetical protein